VYSIITHFSPITDNTTTRTMAQRRRVDTSDDSNDDDALIGSVGVKKAPRKRYREEMEMCVCGV
jgi:hypothetical protein